MSNDEAAAAAPEESLSSSKKSSTERTVLRPYPKVVFFYLTWIAALVCGIVTAMYSGAENEVAVQRFWTLLFLLVFTFNLLVIAFEFGRMVTVSILFGLLMLVFLGLWLGFIGEVFSFLGDIRPTANHVFFFYIFGTFTIIYALVFVQTRFNYWIVRRNELLHKHGFLGDVKRYHAQDVKLAKEIPDIFEFLLLRSGSIVLHMKHEDRAVVLNNIIGINRKEAEVKQILESYAVRIDHD